MSDTGEDWARPDPDPDPGEASDARMETYPSTGPDPWQPPIGLWPRWAYSSLAGLATALQVLLPLNAVIAAGLLAALLHRHALLSRLGHDPASVSMADANSSDTTVGALSLIALLLLIGTGVVFISWLYRARNNADVFGGHVQRRSRGWAIGGWFCPVVNLWFPYQIATDVLYEAESAGAVPPGQQHVTSWRPSYHLIRAWWITLIVPHLLSWFHQGVGLLSVHDLLQQTRLDIATAFFDIVAAMLAVAVVRRITTAHERLKHNFPTSQPWH
jgi:hypothetical protein